MFRCTIFALLSIALASCGSGCSGKVIYTEDTAERYVLVREGEDGYVSDSPILVKDHPDHVYKDLNGDLNFLFSVMHGNNPRIVVESKNKRSYQVVYQLGDNESLNLVAQALGLVVTTEDREIWAITLRQRIGVFGLQPATQGKPVAVDRICCNADGTWPLEGVTADELASFLERRYRRSVVNLTSLEGRWSVLLSEKAGTSWPSDEKSLPLDDTGLALRWERVTIPVTVVKDQPKNK